MLLLTILLYQLTLVKVDCLKILGVFGHPGRSHFDVFEPLLEALAERGHEVTVLSFFPSKQNLPKYKNIVFKGDVLLNVFEMDFFTGGRSEKYLASHDIHQFAKVSCELALASESYHDLLKSDETFDVIISEYFNSNCLIIPIIKKYKLPLIGITSHALLPWSNDWVGNPDNPAYIPVLFLDNSFNMSFLQRVENAVILLFSKLYFKYIVESFERESIKKYLGQDFLPDEDVMYNTSLILSNSFFGLHGARPFVPNVIEVGGIHLSKPKKLNSNIEKWINESTHGIIYFSLGSMIKGHTFPEEKRQMFLRAFARLPQRVLWKWETEMPEKPDNVMIQSWMPQLDILCHPNVKAFISHGGLLGTTESVHCGVPMVILPQYGDQFTNAKAVEANGGGVVLDFRAIDEELIYDALKSVLDPSFNKKAKDLSTRFRDRPLPPMDTAIYWIEYVARHQGAPHLRTAAVNMPFYQYLLLDVILFLITVFSVFVYIFFYILKMIRKITFRKDLSRNKLKKG